MWSGGISNPLSVIEQLTYLLFIKRLNELHTLKEAKANRTGKPIEEPIFNGRQGQLRWSRFKDSLVLANRPGGARHLLKGEGEQWRTTRV